MIVSLSLNIILGIQQVVNEFEFMILIKEEWLVIVTMKEKRINNIIHEKNE